MNSFVQFSDCDTQLEQQAIDVTNTGADFVLKMMSEQKLNQVNVQYVMKVAKILIDQSIRHKMEEVRAVLSAKNIEASCLDDLLDSSIDPFVPLRIQYLLLFILVSPKAVNSHQNSKFNFQI